MVNMETLQSQRHTGCCGGRRTILIILMAYTLLVGVVSLKYLYRYQEVHVKPQNVSMIGSVVHMQNIRNIMQLQSENKNEFLFHRGLESDLNNDNKTLFKNSTSPLISNHTMEVALQSSGNNYSQTDLSNITVQSRPPTIARKITEPPAKKAPTPSRPSVLFRYKSMRTSKPFASHCKSCAIVSSSGQLLGKKLGPEIDSYPCVLRMNTAPVMGFEKDVGHKTTVRVSCFISTRGLMSTPSLFTGTGKPEKVLMWGLQHKKNSWALKNAKSLNSKYKDVEFFAQEEAGEAFAGEIFKQETGQDRAKTNTWLSTGWFTMMAALDMCEDIHVYGMIPEDYCMKNPGSRVKYHYFQLSQNPVECSYYKSQEGSSKGGHRLMTEKAIFERWGMRYNMTFHNPVWNLKPQDSEKRIETPFMKKYAKKPR